VRSILSSTSQGHVQLRIRYIVRTGKDQQGRTGTEAGSWKLEAGEQGETSLRPGPVGELE